MKFYFPLHFDGGNRGCEGIAKGTAKILGMSPNQLIGFCRDIKLDTFLGVDKYVALQGYYPINLLTKFEKKLENIITLGRNKRDNYFKYEYRQFLNLITKQDIMISTGGDMMCYGNNMVNTTNNILRDRGIRTILWGCSMGENNFTPEKYRTLQRFSLIYARESLTYNYFKSLGLQKLVCFPDPAFVLEPEKCDLPHCFLNSEVIGVNLTPFVLKGQSLEESVFGREVKRLLDYILTKTDLHILLIPHVLWTNQDDRVLSKYIMSLYQMTDRISVLDSAVLNYLQIRFVISHCKYFIGGRTHAVISAYSTCVPTIALGYSIKSKGIATDLGLDGKLVYDTTNKFNEYSLSDCFEYLTKNAINIKQHLESIMPEYRKQPYLINSYLSNLE